MTTYNSTLHLAPDLTAVILVCLDYYKNLQNIDGFDPVSRFKSEVICLHPEIIKDRNGADIRISNSFLWVLTSAMESYYSHLNKKLSKDTTRTRLMLRDAISELSGNIEMTSYSHYSNSVTTPK